MDATAPGSLSALLARSALGDRGAFSELYRLTSPKLFSVALRIVRSRDLAEEAVQEAFINVWRRAGDYREDKGLPLPWLVAIVRNRALDLLRGGPKERPLDEDAEVEDWASDDLTPFERLAASREAKALAGCLERLRPEQRQAIALAYYRGLAHEELAGHMGQPLGTIKSWIRRGLEQLKRCLGL
jgi:RNA polymerase sigma-70 factor, ECF subfamily